MLRASERTQRRRESRVAVSELRDDDEDDDDDGAGKLGRASTGLAAVGRLACDALFSCVRFGAPGAQTRRALAVQKVEANGGELLHRAAHEKRDRVVAVDAVEQTAERAAHCVHHTRQRCNDAQSLHVRNSERIEKHCTF